MSEFLIPDAAGKTVKELSIANDEGEDDSVEIKFTDNSAVIVCFTTNRSKVSVIRTQDITAVKDKTTIKVLRK